MQGKKHRAPSSRASTLGVARRALAGNDTARLAVARLRGTPGVVTWEFESSIDSSYLTDQTEGSTVRYSRGKPECLVLPHAVGAGRGCRHGGARLCDVPL